MKHLFFLLITGFFLQLVDSIELYTQEPVLTNNGAIVMVTPQTIITIIGSIVQMDGIMEIGTTATLGVRGDVIVSSGTMRISDTATVSIARNLILVATSATLYQQEEAFLRVDSVLSNNGSIMNRGTIEIGK